MDFNQLKKYPELLDLAYLSVPQRNTSLKHIFKRDIEENHNFNFQGKLIRPTKIEGQASMDTLFYHLTTRIDKDEKGKDLGSRSFEMARSQRIHWIKYLIGVDGKRDFDIFSYEDRVKGRSVVRTYVYDLGQEYVIILEPQRSNTDYYLITAYHLNEPGGKKQIEKKSKKRLATIH